MRKKPEAVAIPEPVMPERKDYADEGAWGTLPFTHLPKKGSGYNFWHVAPTDDDFLAGRLGREYAAHFCRFLREQGTPFKNELSLILHDMFKDEAANAQYRICFVSHLQRALTAYARHFDVYGHVDQVHTYYDQLESMHEARKAKEHEKMKERMAKMRANKVKKPKVAA